MQRSWITRSSIYKYIVESKRSWMKLQKIQLETLHLGSTTLVWWESRTQDDLVQHGKIISTWIIFTATLRKQFYPLAHIVTTMINWQHLR